MSPEPRRRFRAIPWSDVLITIASIVLAFIVGALLMIISDTEVRSKFTYFFARPSDALIASWDKVSSTYAASPITSNPTSARLTVRRLPSRYSIA